MAATGGRAACGGAGNLAVHHLPRDAFDPTNDPIVPPKRFEDLKVGDVFRAPGRTLTPSITSAFQAVSLDNNPRHYNEV
jgi:hypothetical protein